MITLSQEVEILKRNVEELQSQLQEQYKKVVKLTDELHNKQQKMGERVGRLGQDNAQE